MLYFYLWERGPFVQGFLPALAASWRQRSFSPCREMCLDLIPAAKAFSTRYCLGGDPLLLKQVADGLPFERHSWRCLVGEILMIGAVEIPEIETAPDSLCCLLVPDQYRQDNSSRPSFAPIQQVHFGTRDLVFDAAIYRPDYAGWNDRADIERLACYLGDVDPESWRVSDLFSHRDLADDRERAEELEYLQDWFPALRELYRNACDKAQIVICEAIC